MPSLSGQLNTSLTVHQTASDFLSTTYDILMQHEERSNTILPFALAQKQREQWGARPAHNLWVCVWTTRTSSRSAPAKSTLDFVFAINDDNSGGYPLFIWSSCAESDLSSTFVDHRIQLAASQLRRVVPAERVLSVFGSATLVASFHRIWSHTTGKRIEPSLFCNAEFTSYTEFTLQPVINMPGDDILHSATVQDPDQVAMLCLEFAANSVCFSR